MIMKILIIILFIFIVIMNTMMLVAKKQIARFLRKFFGTSDIKKVIEISELQATETPKTLSGMESVALPLINKDFPDTNINELKRQVEAAIISYLGDLERKEYAEIEYESFNVKTYIKSKINDLDKNDIVKYDSIKIHKTIINKYEKNDGIATIHFQTALEYHYSKNSEPIKKVQDRFLTEMIYVIDEEKIKEGSKVIGINCPNCGAPIKKIGNKKCEYCDTPVIDVVKRVWYLNSIDNK